MEDTKFSVKRGFFDAAFSVEITINTIGATIYYTLDGSDPINIDGTVSATGVEYTSPVNITTTSFLRAAAARTGWLPTNIDTQTYIFLDDVLTQNGTGLPAYQPWGHTAIRPGDWAMDSVVVGSGPFTDLKGQSFNMKDALKGVPTLSLVMDWNDWFGGNNTGIYSNALAADAGGWERVVSSEYILPDGSDGFQLNSAIRVVGGSSVEFLWKSDKVSMRLIFKQRLNDGTPTGGSGKLKYKMFADTKMDEFNTLTLDARLNNAWNYGFNHDQRNKGQNTRDQYVADLQNAVGGFAPHGQHVHLYINGLYWGLYNVHERPDTSFAASYFGGDSEDYDCIKHGKENVVNVDPGTPEETRGLNNYQALVNAAALSLTNKTNYEALLELLDVENFIDYMLVNFYVGNTDWDRHNWYVTRNWKEPGGKWRYHSWDAEKGMQGVMALSYFFIVGT